MSWVYNGDRRDTNRSASKSWGVRAEGGPNDRMTERRFPIVMEEVTDPEELDRARARRERFDRNAAWLHSHGAEVYPRHRGKYLCIAGEELFVADTPEEALALATAAHPEDDGRFLHYIPLERVPRIYADRR